MPGLLEETLPNRYVETSLKERCDERMHDYYYPKAFNIDMEAPFSKYRRLTMINEPKLNSGCRNIHIILKAIMMSDTIIRCIFRFEILVQYCDDFTHDFHEERERERKMIL